MDPLILIAIGLVIVLVVLVVVVLLVRRRSRHKPAGSAEAAAPPAAASFELAHPVSLTSLIGEAKVRKPAASGKVPPPRPGDSPASPPLIVPEATKSTTALVPKRLVEPGHRGNKIQILIVDDNRDTCDNVSRLITFESDMEVVGQGYNGISGVELAKEYRPHIVLMDINMPDMDGITATREMAVQVPYCQIIIMSVQFETDYMRSAMLAGARDYQTKPFTADELVNCIRRVYNSAKETYRKYDEPGGPGAQTPLSEVAVIERVASGLRVPLYMMYSPKGGVGSSSIAVNFAAALERKQHGVTLFDADLQFGDLPVLLNMRPTKSLSDLITTGRPDAEVLPDLLLAHSSGVNVLFAPPKPENAELITASMVLQAARRLRDQSSAVIIDSASYLTDYNLALLDIVDVVLLIITPDLASIKDARIFCDMAPLLGLNPQRLALVINRFNQPGALPAPQIEKAIGLSRTFMIPDDPKLRYASAKGVTIFQLDEQAPSAQAIAALAQALWDLITAPKSAAVDAGASPKGK